MQQYKMFLLEFPGGPVIRTWYIHCQGLSSIPGQGTTILQAVQPSQKKKKCSIKTHRKAERVGDKNKNKEQGQQIENINKYGSYYSNYVK